MNKPTTIKTNIALLAALLLAPAAALRAAEPPMVDTNHLVILRASGMKPDASAAVAPLDRLGAHSALEEASARRGLSLRPWDGHSFQDYNWIYEPGAPMSFRVQAASAKDCAQTVVSLWDWSGNIVYSKTYTAFPVDDILTLKAQCRGVWLVTFDAYADTTVASLKSRLVKSFGTPVDATSARKLWREKNGYLLGSCFFPDRYYRGWKGWRFDNPPFPKLTPDEGIDRLASLAARAGISVLRCDSLGHSERADSKPRWDTLMEELGILQRHSIQADLKFYLWPGCFVGQTLERNEKLFAVWSEDLDYLIEHFLIPAKTMVAMVELGNEPAHQEFWSGTREQYQWLSGYARSKIHAANRAMPVLLGGSCPPGADLSGEKLKDPIGYAIKKKAQADWYLGFYHDMAAQENLWAYHQHGDLNTDAITWRGWERSELSKAGFTGSFLQTEGGCCAWRPDREVLTWMEVLQKIIYSQSCGEKGWLQYDLATKTTPSRYNDSVGWDLIHAYDFTPKFQYGAIAAMTKTLAGCTLERTLVLDQTGKTPSLVVLFNHPNGKMIAWFGNTQKAGLRVRSDASEVTFIDPMGNEIETRPGGEATIRFELYPQYLLLAGATHAESFGKEANQDSGASKQPKKQ